MWASSCTSTRTFHTICVRSTCSAYMESTTMDVVDSDTFQSNADAPTYTQEQALSYIKPRPPTTSTFCEMFAPSRTRSGSRLGTYIAASTKHPVRRRNSISTSSSSTSTTSHMPISSLTQICLPISTRSSFNTASTSSSDSCSPRIRVGTTLFSQS